MVVLELHFSDAYGLEAAEALRPIQAPLATLATLFAENFYSSLSSAHEIADLLKRFGAEEFARLKQRQAQYTAQLLSPGLELDQHLAAAERVGQIHAHVGVDIQWLAEAYSLYQQEIRRMVRKLVPRSKEREMIMNVVNHRIMCDLQAQLSSYHRMEEEVAKSMARVDHLALTASNLPDLVRGVMETICSPMGKVVSFFGRADSQGQLQIEATYGRQAELYHQAMENGRIPKISIDPNLPAGQGPGGQSWRSGKIMVSDAWALEDALSPWRSVGFELGFRSSATLPLVDASGHTLALITLYSGWPGYFSTSRVRGLLSHVQEVLGHAVQRMTPVAIVPWREQQAYREMLEQGRVTLLYQPIISLQDGRMVKVEALARLKGHDGHLVAPNHFLPAFGKDELFQLFERVIKQACADCLYFERQGLITQVSVNCPAEGFSDSRYEYALKQVLKDCGLSGSRLELEMLETQGTASPGEQFAFCERMREAGIQIAQDDLGSGHSSLLRFDQYRFDTVKIDQGLVRSSLSNPQRALGFILHLTRLAHAFKTPVIVEGLENHGLIEAATLLGADYGQGFGIAKPMPPEALMAWERDYGLSVDQQNPRTALGALASYLLWDAQLAAVAHRPDLLKDFTGHDTVVDQYIVARSLQKSPLAQLLKSNLEQARRGVMEGPYQQSRAQVIDMLSGHWLAEVGNET
jgi:EAL domain-containing protein (putative c-di-GMP-specific phosphodiesterase class I)